MSGEPQTAAGRAMYAKWGHPNFMQEWNAAILAIEAEAIAQERGLDAGEAEHHVREAKEWLAVEASDPGTVARAQVHATLAVAEAVLSLRVALQDRSA